MLILIAWRNLWRKPLRTAICIGAVAFATFVLIIGASLMEGVVGQTVSRATQLVLGEVVIQHPEYAKERSLFDTIRNPDHLMAKLENEDVQVVVRRYGDGLVAGERHSGGGRIWGVDPLAEIQAFSLPSMLFQGEFLGPKPNKRVLIGKKLARTLQAKVGTQLVMMVQGADGSMGADLYTVEGIFLAVNDHFDRTATMIHKDDFDTLFSMKGSAHEVVLNSKSRVPTDELRLHAERFATTLRVRPWGELVPIVLELEQMVRVNMIIFGIVFGLAATLGIANTLFMAAHDRVHEFALLKALGTRPIQLIAQMLLEGVMIFIIAVALGALVSLPAAHYLEVVGIDTGAISGQFSIAGVAIDPIWRASLKVQHILFAAELLFAASLLGALYPAILAARMAPADAMRMRRG